MEVLGVMRTRTRVLVSVAALAVAAVAPAPANGVGLESVGVSSDGSDACSLVAESPFITEGTVATAKGRGHLWCPTAGPANVIDVTWEVCAEQAFFAEIFKVFFGGDGCTARRYYLDRSSIYAYELADEVNCSSTRPPLFRTSVYARVRFPDGSRADLEDASDPRPYACF